MGETHASAGAMDFSQSFASLLHLPVMRRCARRAGGKTSKPLMPSVRLTISTEKEPILCSAPFGFGPA